MAECPFDLLWGTATDSRWLLPPSASRLGPNYLQLPANAPKCPYHNNHHDGLMNFMHRDEEVNYFPSRFDPVRHAEPTPVSAQHYDGKREKMMIAKENNFAQVAPGGRGKGWLRLCLWKLLVSCD